MAPARTQQGSVPTDPARGGRLLAHARSCEGHQHFTTHPVQSAVGMGGAWGARQPGAAAVEEQLPHSTAAGPWGLELPHRSQHGPTRPTWPHSPPMQPAQPRQPPHGCSPRELRLLPSPVQVPGGQGIIFISFAAGLRLWGVSFASRAFPQAAFNHYLKASLQEPRLDHSLMLAQGSISSPHNPAGRVLPCLGAPQAALATTSSAGDKPWGTCQGSEQAGLISTSQRMWLQPLCHGRAAGRVP